MFQCSVRGCPVVGGGEGGSGETEEGPLEPRGMVSGILHSN